MLSKIQRWLGVFLVIGALVLGGCNRQAETPSASASPLASSPAPTETAGSATQPSNSQFNNLPRLNGKATVVMVVKGSSITIDVDGTDAPITAGNFVDLVQRKVYDGLVFHRVVREPKPFVVQGGDPQGKDPSFPAGGLGTGSFIDPTTSQPRYVPLEIKVQGQAEPVYSTTLSDLRTAEIQKKVQGGETPQAAEGSTPVLKPVLTHKRGAVAMARSQDPDSASAQFYFALTELDFLDGSYAVFGYVTEGMDAVDKIQQGDRIESAKVTQGAENLKTAG